jgi:hypothetical protein
MWLGTALRSEAVVVRGSKWWADAGFVAQQMYSENGFDAQSK